jgi:hypothetical protein
LEAGVKMGYNVIPLILRFDNQPVKIRIGDQKNPRDRRKLGAIIAKNAFWCQCHTLPGATIAANSIIYPSSIVK